MKFIRLTAALVTLLAGLLFAGPVAAQFAAQSTFITGAGSANAQTATLPNLNALANIKGVPVTVVAGVSNTGATTLSLTGTTATAVKKFSQGGLIALTGGEIISGQPFTVVYDGTQYVLMTQSMQVAGGTRGLLVTNGNNTQRMAVTADAITVETVGGFATRLTSVSVVCDLAVSGAGGIDTGSMNANTWYSEWVIYNPSAASVSCLLSTSASAPTLPAGYTMRARVGWNRTDSTAPSATRFNRVTCYGPRCAYKVTPSSATQMLPVVASGAAGTYSDTSPTLANVSLSAAIPATATQVMVNATGRWKNLSTSQVLLSPSTDWGGTNNGSLGSNGVVWFMSTDIGISVTQQVTFILETSQQISWASSAAGGAIAVYGWLDNF